MRAAVGKFGLMPGLCVVEPGLLGVRREDRDVEGSVGVAEDVGRSEVGARNEARYLSLSSAVTGLSRSVHKCGDRVVAARGFAQSAAGGVGSDCVQESRLASGERHRFTGPGAAQALANRVAVLLGLHHCSMMRVEAPHPCVINLSVTKFQQPCVSTSKSSRSRASEAAPDGHPCPHKW